MAKNKTNPIPAVLSALLWSAFLLPGAAQDTFVVGDVIVKGAEGMSVSQSEAYENVYWLLEGNPLGARYGAPGFYHLVARNMTLFEDVYYVEPTCEVAGLPSDARGNGFTHGRAVHTNITSQSGEEFLFFCLCSMSGKAFSACTVYKNITQQTVLEFSVTDDRRNQPHTWPGIASAVDRFIEDYIAIVDVR